MRSGKPGGVRWAAWLALAALALNALVPVHVAFDVAEAIEATQAPASVGGTHDNLHDVLALLSGHRDAGHQSHRHDKNRQTSCAVCAAIGTLGGFVQPAVIALLLPPPGASPIALPGIAAEPGGIPLSYRSRAPPVA